MINLSGGFCAYRIEHIKSGYTYKRRHHGPELPLHAGGVSAQLLPASPCALPGRRLCACLFVYFFNVTSQYSTAWICWFLTSCLPLDFSVIPSLCDNKGCD